LQKLYKNPCLRRELDEYFIGRQSAEGARIKRGGKKNTMEVNVSFHSGFTIPPVAESTHC
jgi:hypothetical protein